MKPKTTPDLVHIEGDDIVIRVSLDALIFATEHGPALEQFDDPQPRTQRS